MVSPNTDQLAMVKSNGDIIWVPAMNFRTFCPLDLTHFPFDEHECEITVITWTYDEAEVNSNIFLAIKMRIVEKNLFISII